MTTQSIRRAEGEDVPTACTRIKPIIIIISVIIGPLVWHLPH